MTCVYRAWRWNQNGTWAMTTAKNKILLGCKMKLLLTGEWAFARENWKFGGGVFTEGGDFSWWVDRGAEGWVNFQLVGGLPYPPSRENPMIDQSFLH